MFCRQWCREALEARERTRGVPHMASSDQCWLKPTLSCLLALEWELVDEVAQVGMEKMQVAPW